MASKGKQGRSRKTGKAKPRSSGGVLERISTAIWDGQLSANLLVSLFSRDHDVRQLDHEAEPARRKVLETIMFSLCESLLLARTRPGVSQYCELTLRPRLVLISWGDTEDDAVWSPWQSAMVFEAEETYEAVKKKLVSREEELLELMGATDRSTGAVVWVAPLAPGKAGAVFLVVVHCVGKEDSFYIADAKEMIGLAPGVAAQHAVGFAVAVSSVNSQAGLSDVWEVADELMSPVVDSFIDGIEPAMTELAASSGAVPVGGANKLPPLIEHVTAGIVAKFDEMSCETRAAFADQLDAFLEPVVNNEMELLRAVGRVGKAMKKHAQQQDEKHAAELARWKNLYNKSSERERMSAVRIAELTRAGGSSADSKPLAALSGPVEDKAEFAGSLALQLDRLFM